MIPSWDSVTKRKNNEYKLIGTHCRDCGSRFFPGRVTCPQCGSNQLAERLLGNEGVIHAFTIVRVKPPEGFQTPYVVCYVKLLDDDLIIPAYLEVENPEILQIGMKVQLHAISTDLVNELPAWTFRLSEGGASI